MNLIDWRDEYSVNVKEIDAQHQKLIVMINDLHQGMSQGLGKAMLSDILNRMIDYAQEHFATEEKYMDQWNYPDTDNHKHEHQQFAEQVVEFKQGYDENKLFLSVDVLKFLSNWLDEHLQKMDMKYKDFFNNHGLF